MAGNTTRSEAQQSFFVYIRDNNTGVIKRVAIPGDVQIGLEGAPAELHLLGRLAISAKTYAIDNTNKGVVVISNDETVVALRLEVTPLSGRITVKLPPTPREGQLHFIKDLTGQADLVPIDIYAAPGYTIDGAVSKTLSDAYGSLALVWLNGQWRILVAGIGASGGAGGSADASYVTITPEASLSNERHLTGSANITITDNGANASVVLNLSQLLMGGGTYAYATVTVDAYGRVTGISSNPSPPSVNAGFLTAGAEPTLPNRRVMSGGIGTTVTDGGAGTTFSFNVDPTVVPFLNVENTFLQPNIFNLGLSGSLTRLANGTAYIVGFGGVSVTSASNGQVFLSGTQVNGIAGTGGTAVSFGSDSYVVSSSIGADKFASYLVLTSSALVPQAQLLTAGTNVTFSDAGPGSTLTINATGGGITTSSFVVPSILEWGVAASTLPTAISHMSNIVTVGNKLWAYGGFTSPGVASSVILTASVSSPTSWGILSTSMPYGTWDAHVLIANNKVCIFTSGTFMTASVTDPGIVGNTTSSFPGGLSISPKGHMAIIGNYAMLFGGLQASSPFATNVIYSASLSDPLAFTDTGITLPAARRAAQLLVTPDSIYMFGGLDTGSIARPNIYRAKTNNPTVWRDTNAFLPRAIAGGELLVVGDNAYILGGNNADLTTTSSIMFANLNSPTFWQLSATGAAIPSARQSFAVAVCSGTAVAIGGINNSGTWFDSIFVTETALTASTLNSLSSYSAYEAVPGMSKRGAFTSLSSQQRVGHHEWWSDYSKQA